MEKVVEFHLGTNTDWENMDGAVGEGRAGVSCWRDCATLGDKRQQQKKYVWVRKT